MESKGGKVMTVEDEVEERVCYVGRWRRKNLVKRKIKGGVGN